MGSTVKERRIASLNFVKCEVGQNAFCRASRRIAKSRSSPCPTRDRAAKVRPAAARQIESALGDQPSISARKFDGLCSAGGGLEIESDIELENKSAFQILDQ